MRTVTLALTISREGELFFWPLRMADEDGKWNSAHEDAYRAAKRAQEVWVRLFWESGKYKVLTSEPGIIKDPNWPDLEIKELVTLACKSHVITDINDPVLQRLRGEA